MPEVTDADSTRAEKPKPRKPLRRTAVALTVVGLLGLGAFVGLTYLTRAGGQDIGPAKVATWPAGERAAVFKPLRPGQREGETTLTCTATDERGGWQTMELHYGELETPPVERRLTCDGPAVLVTGTASVIASALYTRGYLFGLPLVVLVVGVLCFFPRFALWWASIGSPMLSRLLLRRRR